jgi:hypothetical protein
VLLVFAIVPVADSLLSAAPPLPPQADLVNEIAGLPTAEGVVAALVGLLLVLTDEAFQKTVAAWRLNVGVRKRAEKRSQIIARMTISQYLDRGCGFFRETAKGTKNSRSFLGHHGPGKARTNRIANDRGKPSRPKSPR